MLRFDVALCALAVLRSGRRALEPTMACKERDYIGEFIPQFLREEGYADKFEAFKERADAKNMSMNASVRTLNTILGGESIPPPANRGVIAQGNNR